MKNKIFEKEFRALGTDIYIQLVNNNFSGEKAQADLDKVVEIYKEKEVILSRFRKESELSNINNNLDNFQRVSLDILYVAKKSLDYYRESEGVFDPRILEKLESIGYRKDFSQNNFKNKGEFRAEIFKNNLADDLIIKDDEVKFLKRMDFSGIAKGYITDKVAEFLISCGWRNFLVDSGGDMYLSGKNKLGQKWGIALEESEDENDIIIEASDNGLATSGNTRKHWNMGDKNFHHLINPKNLDEFKFDLMSVTVVGKSTQWADVMAKVLFLKGLESGIKFADNNNIKSIFLKKDKSIIKSNALL